MKLLQSTRHSISLIKKKIRIIFSIKAPGFLESFTSVFVLFKVVILTAKTKMIKLLLSLHLLVAVLSAPESGYDEFKLAEDCNATQCKLPNCRCSSTDIPNGIKVQEVPQLVMFTFDDAVTEHNFNYYQQAFAGKKNPDGCPVGVTYFLSHEYADYGKVHELHAQGYEIALHSITHLSDTEYWKKLSVDGLKKEFDGLRKIITHFAGIPETDTYGIRLPFLQLSGNNSFELIKQLKLQYDSSWPTQTYMNPPLWPYTLDYKSVQDCSIGPCPTASIPGVWVMPMVNWVDQKGVMCAMVDACVNIPDKVDDLFKFFVSNFERHYKSNRAPFGFYVHAAWFDRNVEVYFGAYKKFVDYLLTLKDVYLVSVERARQWVQNPVPLKGNATLWPSCQKTRTPTCKPLKCKLNKGTEERWMTICRDKCPAEYPWLGNPLGEKQ